MKIRVNAEDIRKALELYCNEKLFSTGHKVVSMTDEGTGKSLCIDVEVELQSEQEVEKQFVDLEEELKQSL